jgi:N-acetylmuramoyl-L-alanine amidase
MLFKKLVTLCVSIALLLSLLLVLNAGASNISILINNAPFVASSDSFLVDGETYVPLKDFTYAINPEAQIDWDTISRKISVYSHGMDIHLSYGEDYISVNGRYLYIPNGVFANNGVTYIQLCGYAKALGAAAVWSQSLQSVYVSYSGTPLSLPGGAYDEDDLYWLSRIISAEARGEPLKGQIAVGNVVLNRVAYKSYPNTIRGVIFDKVSGIQFTPIANGSIYDEPTEKAVIAAKLVLDGANTAGESLFFLNERTATSAWAPRHRTYYASIGNHNFYL